MDGRWIRWVDVIAVLGITMDEWIDGELDG